MSTIMLVLLTDFALVSDLDFSKNTNSDVSFSFLFPDLCHAGFRLGRLFLLDKKLVPRSLIVDSNLLQDR
ncbi:unnamed protein product [Hymenolepis diminuta]|uniref:Uncharacterized protein n=1 Tax=Hymenolepis diminuta TaxID=6216 RepID=A0A564Y5N9_HYMDI|nr:unnamed protein product [Hymenolepis diminuta]